MTCLDDDVEEEGEILGEKADSELLSELWHQYNEGPFGDTFSKTYCKMETKESQVNWSQPECTTKIEMMKTKTGGMLVT